MESAPFGPFDRWPTGLGFEHFYGFFGATSDQWNPNLIENTRSIDPPARPEDGYHLDVDLADRAIAWMRLQRSVVPDRPFFVYYAPATAHEPHHAPRAWIDHYRGRFDHGWDRQRELTFEEQQQLGVVPPGTTLTPRPPQIPAWDSLTENGRRLACRLQEAFAGSLSHCDEQIGRVLASVDQLGERDNTIVIYIVGDNGPSPGGRLGGVFNKWALMNGFEESEDELIGRLDEVGSPRSANDYPVGWAWAGTSPLQWFKQVASHFGGTRNGLVVSWPRSIRDAGGLRTQFHHCVDIFPTILEAAMIPQPETVDGVRQSDLDGVDMSYSFAAPTAESPRRTQYFEMLGNRALYHEGWIASARHGRLPWEQSMGAGTGEFDDDPWELYHVDADFSQARDVAVSEPKRLEELQALWWSEAERNASCR